MSTYANRGMFLENMVTQSNVTYKIRNIALITKIATPIQYNKRTGKAFFKEKSTVDFTGVINNGPFIAFDAKQIKGKSFPFAKIEPHQIEYMQTIQEMGHVGFVLIYFSDLDECYRVDIDRFTEYKETNDRKSIPVKWCQENATRIKSGYGLPFDYLKGLINE